MQCTSFRRQDDEIRGRHLVAARNIKKGEIIFCERPLCSLQSLENVHQGALVCRCCRAFCGGPSLCLKLASGSLERENIFDDSNLIPCRQKCGEVFCSKECEQDFWSCHELLCTGPIEDANHPLLQWKRHAIENNEIFLLVGDVVASIVAHPDLMDTFHDFSMVPWWNVATLSFANASDSTEALELSSQCKRLCEESSKLLNDVLKLKGVESDFVTPLFIGQVIGAFEQNSMGIRARHPLCRDILSMKALRYHQHDDVVSCLGKAGFLGCDDDDDMSVEAEEETATETFMSGMQVAPIEVCDTSERKHVDAMSPDDVAEILASLNIDEHSGEDDLDAIFSPLDGTAMYNLICKMNHSCCPNVVVVYRSLQWGEPLVAQCIAQHDIDEGEELCISYIDANQPFSVRSFELLNYGFACNCTKCISDRAALQALEPQESDYDTNIQTEILDLSQETNPPSETLSGEESLQLKFDEILKVSDSSDYASIPMAIYSETQSLISKLTSDILPSLDPESDVAVSLVNCLAATNLRYFSECFEIGTRFVNQLLENSEGYFSEKLHHMIWVGSLTAAMGMAHFGSFLKALEMLDKAMIFKFNRMEIPHFVSYVELHANEAYGGPLVARNVAFHSPSPIELPIYLRSMPRLIPEITEHHLPDGLLETAKVIIVRELAKDWIAMSKWSSPSWFVKKYGHRLVSVVVSPSPSIENKAAQVMCVRSFFSDFLLLHGDRFYWTIKEALSLKTACLHEYGIMDQIPELYEFIQPATAFLGTQVQVKVDVGIQSAGSRTQLSRESRNIMFVQIVGVNYLRLYDSKESHKLYLYTSRESYLVSERSYSAVSCEDEDFDLHPLAKDASYHDTYLFPGDALFIPSNSFFYIRSICTAIHVDYQW